VHAAQGKGAYVIEDVTFLIEAIWGGQKGAKVP
jgi:hypothetical protein